METLTEPIIPKTLHSKTANSEHSEVPGASDGETAATPELRTWRNGIPDREKKSRGQTELEDSKADCSSKTELEDSKTPNPDEKTEEKQRIFESSKAECKTGTPDEKTEEKERILVPKNGPMDGLKMPKSPGKVSLECKTPTPVKENGRQRLKFGGVELPKNGTPNRLKVPIAFKYPERYTSPTDLMMSPITKGLLARTRKGGPVPSKMHELRIQGMSLQS